MYKKMGATIGRMKNIGRMDIGSYMDTYRINRRLAKLDKLITCEDMIQKNAARATSLANAIK
jgi:hypothetical protein